MEERLDDVELWLRGSLSRNFADRQDSDPGSRRRHVDLRDRTV